VRALETACPFCRCERGFSDITEPPLPEPSLGRSARIAFRSLRMAGLVAAASSSLAVEGCMTPMYGAPAVRAP
jgi:hypothetical protein